MLPFLVAHLIFIIFVMAVVFIGGFFVTVSSLEWRVIIPLIATAVYVCKYYFEKRVINIFFVF